MDEQQQHRQERAAGGGDPANPYHWGDRVRLNAAARGKWPRHARDVGTVAEEPGRYMVSVKWDAGAAEGSSLLHYGWLEPWVGDQEGGGRGAGD